MKELFKSVIIKILTIEARLVLRKYHPNVVLVTGSVGKTSTKDALYATLSQKYYVRKSEKSFNSDIGTPLTVLGVPNGWNNPLLWLRNCISGLFLILVRSPYPEWLIIEVGADRPGDISYSLKWLRPTMVVATRFPNMPVHVEFYDSPEAVQQEELSPLRWLHPGGVAVLNADDELVANVALPEEVERVLYGLSDADVHASKIHTLVTHGMPHGTSFDVSYKGERAHVSIEGIAGNAHVYAVLGGIAGAVALGVPLVAAAEGAAAHVGPAGRMRLLAGKNGTVLLEDSYNASPIAVEEALRTLASLPHTGRRSAMLGDMIELGPYSVAEHEKVGRMAAHAADVLVTVGVRARSIAASAEAAGMQRANIFQFDRAVDAAEHVQTIIAEGDVVLIKGSQSMRMERASKLLMAHPEDAKHVLPRQDAEWLAR